MLKVLELFSGIGSQTQALKNIGIEHISTQCDIDKYAVDAYNQLHGETTNLGDISKISPDNLQEGQWDLITYSFPCTDISLAGRQEGLAKDSGTRSSLLWECEKIFRKVKPKYLLMENVKNLVGKKFLPYFNEWLKILEDMGYKNYWKVLNAKDYGIPQNRERVFCVSILGEHKPYVFPEPKPLTLRLKDMLEEKVDEKYYLSDDMIQQFKEKVENKPTIDNNEKENRLFNIYGDDKGTGYAGNVWDDKSLCPALKTMQGGNQQPMIIEEPEIKVVGNYKPSGHECGRVMDVAGIAPTIKENHGAVCAIYEVQLPNGKKAKIDGIEEATCLKEVRTEAGKQARREARQAGLGDTTPRNKDTKEFVPQNNGIANCIMTGAGIDQMIAEPNNSQYRFYEQAFETLEENNCQEGDTIDAFNKKVNSTGVCPTITTRPEGFKTAILNVVKNDEQKPFRIRKLTPKECWRLMGWTDEQIEKVKGISNCQLYKQAGNSIVVNVLEEIFRNMLLT